MVAQVAPIFEWTLFSTNPFSMSHSANKRSQKGTPRGPARRLVAVGLSLLNISLLTACSHNEPVAQQSVPKAAPKESVAELEDDAKTRLVSDIIHAKTVEAGELRGTDASSPVTITEATGDQKTYHYANLRAFRADIRHRMDSLRKAGVAVEYDTLVTVPIVSGKLKPIHN